MSHDQVICVFLQCHLSASDQCSNIKSVVHVCCATLIGQGGLGHFGCLKRILCLSSTPTVYTEIRLSPHQCLQNLTKTMLNPPMFKKAHVKQKFRREPLSPNTVNGPVKGTKTLLVRKLWNQIEEIQAGLDSSLWHELLGISGN